MTYDPLHLLIVDDDEDDFLLVSELFDEIPDLQCVLEWATTYTEALEAFAHRRHDAYLLDNYLGEHTGMDLLREMMTQGCLAPIIMFTGQGNRALDLEAMEAGATDYLVKSRLNADLLERSIRHAIARKQAEKELVEKTEALERSNKELEMFSYVASHDLQAPLRTISGFASLLQQRYHGNLDANADRFIDFIVEGTAHMQTLITDLLAYSREGRHSIKRQRIDVNEMLQHTLNNLRATLDEEEAVVTSDPLPIIEADATQIERLLQNLISNGVKFRREIRPRVHVSAKQEDGMWCFSVQDNGIGIGKKHHDQVFEIFRRLHTQSAYEGTGIGLAICKKIVERHEGRIWVTSEPGQGSTFSFTLPIDFHPTEKPSEKTPLVVPLRP